MNKNAFYQLTYGLYIVSAEAEGQRGGCVVNTLQQVTSEPVRLSVTVNKDNFTCELIRKAGRFSAVVLDQRADLMTVGRFGFRSGRDMDKFAEVTSFQDGAGMPFPAEAVCARFSCRVENIVDLGTHIMFIGLAEEAEIMAEHEPLTYAYYRNVIKGGTPKNAPSFQG